MRPRTFCALELGRSVLRSGGRTVITVQGEMLKSGRSWEAPLPQVLADPFARYLDEVRPWLMEHGHASHHRLWVGDRGRPYATGQLSQRILTVTQTLTGVRVPPHFFRNAAATTAARASPAAARLIRPLLGHADYGTAERHYIHAQGIEAGRDYARLLARLRQEPNDDWTVLRRSEPLFSRQKSQEMHDADDHQAGKAALAPISRARCEPRVSRKALSRSG